MKLSFGERLKIRRLANGQNVNWQAISNNIGCSVNAAKDVVDQYYSPKFRRMVPKPKHSKIPRMDGQWGRRAAGLSYDQNKLPHVPAEVLADRDHRAELESSSFGGPKPGYSALDRKGAKP